MGQLNMDSMDVVSLLRKPATLKGVPVKETDMFKDLSGLDLSEQRANAYICSLHNYLERSGAQAAAEKILLVFRIHPLVAVRTIETSSLAADMRTLSYAFKLLISVARGDYGFQWEDVILNDHKVRYLIMLIEAIFQNSVCETFDVRDVILEYVCRRERAIHESGNPKWIRVLTNKNVQEIITHIPENQQIELINWFWNKHLYTFCKYRKTDTFNARKVAAMLEVLPEGALWRHLENAEKEKLSDEEEEKFPNRELAMAEREREEIANFIRSVVVDEEGHHIEYVEQVLGKTDFYKKLEALLGPGFRKEYDRRKR